MAAKFCYTYYIQRLHVRVDEHLLMQVRKCFYDVVRDPSHLVKVSAGDAAVDDRVIETRSASSSTMRLANPSKRPVPVASVGLRHVVAAASLRQARRAVDPPRSAFLSITSPGRSVADLFYLGEGIVPDCGAHVHRLDGDDIVVVQARPASQFRYDLVGPSQWP